MIILVGASASGKTEVAKYLKQHYGIKKVVTHTTRSMRTNEVDGVDYHFVDKQTFLALKNQNYFVEVTNYNNNYYGTSRDEVSDDSSTQSRAGAADEIIHQADCRQQRIGDKYSPCFADGHGVAHDALFCKEYFCTIQICRIKGAAR